mgnify:CR=1 FL=1
MLSIHRSGLYYQPCSESEENLAIMRLEQAKGTLLEFNRISLDHPPAPEESDVLSKLRILGSTRVTQ